MPVSDNALSFMVTEWEAALEDAEVDSEDYYLIVCPGNPVIGEPQAVCLRPGVRLETADDSGGIVVGDLELTEANSSAALSRHRIAVLDGVDRGDEPRIAYLAALLRHEIEHTRQRAVADDAFDLLPPVDEIIEWTCGDDKTCSRDLTNSQPIEADAHAAASAYVRRRYPGAVDALLHTPDRYLVERTDPPGRAETLIRRTVEFLQQFTAVVCDPVYLSGAADFGEVLDEYLAGSSRYWQA